MAIRRGRVIWLWGGGNGVVVPMKVGREMWLYMFFLLFLFVFLFSFLFLFLFYLFLFIFIFCQVEFTWKANLVFRQEELTGLDRKFKICQLMYFKISLAISKTSTIQIKFDPNLKFIVQLPIILRRIKK